ncbi:MAG: vitamin K epoxide reductase family protein [Spirochaetota bacterium]
MKNELRQKLFKLAIAILSLGGLVLSLYLMFIHYFPQEPGTLLYSMCTMGQSTDCGLVNTSVYSHFLGIPLGGWGALLYAALLLILFYMKVMEEDYAQNLKPVLFLGGLLSVLVSIPLAVISAVLLNTFCTLCAVLWIINVSILLVSLWWITTEKKVDAETTTNSLEETRDLLFIPLWKAVTTFRRSSIIAVNLLLVLVAIVAVNDSLETQKEITNMLVRQQAEARLLSEYSSFPAVEVDTSRVPVYAGFKNAPVEVVAYFDFNCGVCHRTILMLENLTEKYPGQVVLYLMHFPLDGRCNPSMSRNAPGNSCAAARAVISRYGKTGYMPLTDRLLNHEGLVDMKAIQSASENAGLSWDEVSGDMKKQSTIEQLENEIHEALSMDINATPNLIVNGKKLPAGMPPEHLLQRVIQIELEKTEKKN